MSISAWLTPVTLGRRQPPWRRVAGVGLVALLLGVTLLGLQLVRVGDAPTGPVFVGSVWRLDDLLAERGLDVKVHEGHGYDGQWFYALALDPLLREDLTSGFDMPRYRANRPLLGMTAWLLAAGQSAAVGVTLLAIGPLAMAAGSVACARIALATGRSRWWGLGFAAIPGVMVGVTHATAEPLGLAFVALGLSLTLDSRRGPESSGLLESASMDGPESRRGRRGAPAAVLAGLAFAAAGLTKESYLVFALVAAAAVVLERSGVAAWERWRRAAWVLLPGPVLLAGWWGYVTARVPPSAGDANATDALGVPGAGWAGALARLVAGEWVADVPIGLAGPVVMFGSLAVLLAGIAAGVRKPGLLGWSALALGGYGLVLSAYLLGHFLSSMRALAPCMLAAGLGVLSLAAPPAEEPPADATPPPGELATR